MGWPRHEACFPENEGFTQNTKTALSFPNDCHTTKPTDKEEHRHEESPQNSFENNRFMAIFSSVALTGFCPFALVR